MKSRADLYHQTCKSSLSVIPDLTCLNSSNNSIRQLGEVTKTKSTERIDTTKDSPNLQPKAQTLTKTRESGRIIKNAAKSLSKKELRVKENFLINSNSTKNIQAKKSLPKLNVKIGETAKVSTFQSILKVQNNRKLKHLSLNEELKVNSLVISEGSDYRAKSWLENIIAVKDKSIEGDLNENLKFCNGLIRDIIVRLKQSGKENESILIEKTWRVLFEMIDDHMEKFQSKVLEYEKKIYNSMSVTEVSQDLKEGYEKKVRDLEMKIDQMDFDSSLKEFQIPPEKYEKFQSLISGVKNRIEELYDIHQINEVKRHHVKRKSMANPNWFLTRNKIKNKKSMDMFRPNLIEIQEV